MPAAVHCGLAFWRRAVDAGDAREIERRTGITALDIYGLSEVMGPGVAMECTKPLTARPSGKTTSSRKSSTDDGTPLEDGEHGELLFTTLTKKRCR